MKTTILAGMVAFGIFIPGRGWCQAERAKSGRNGSANDGYAELKEAPEKARLRQNPLEQDPEAVLAGKKLFLRHCAECHGETGQGAKRGPSLRAAEVQNATDGTLFWVLSNGVVRRGMPVWSKLPEAQRWQIVRFLKRLGRETPGEPAASTSPPR